jgi:Tat protein secretion system quality control protein TatD with DNase activity
VEPPPLVDTHCHLTVEAFGFPIATRPIERARAAGVTACVVVALDAASAVEAAELAERHPGWAVATAGVHPTQEAVSDPAEWARVEEAARLGALPGRGREPVSTTNHREGPPGEAGPVAATGTSRPPWPTTCR